MTPWLKIQRVGRMLPLQVVVVVVVVEESAGGTEV
jgi:hypothetical protein